jgi:glutamate--cysteine ligase
MARDVMDNAEISRHDQLVEALERGCKPQNTWRIGTEHEKIAFFTKEFSPVPYEGSSGIRCLLEILATETGWEPILEQGLPIGLISPEGAAVSLEPGGQFELSGAPLKTIHETKAETQTHLMHVKAIGERLGMSFLHLAHTPLWPLSQTPVMPKGRYKIMSAYMPKVGTLGRDMMFRTATIQANLDFSCEIDMVKKLRVSLALQPVISALFANSPFVEGKKTSFLSRRSAIWLDTDKDRTGPLPFAFEAGMGFDRYVEYALDVPMYFLKRGDHYHDVSGASFRDFMAGRLKGFEGQKPLRSDWLNHLSTLFPDVRLKTYLEMRGADMGPLSHILALPAFWTGLLYFQPALDAAQDLINIWNSEERAQLREDAPRLGLDAKIGGRRILDLARDLLALAAQGLVARANLNESGEDESLYLEPLYERIESRKTLATLWRERFDGRWEQSVKPAFTDCVL